MEMNNVINVKTISGVVVGVAVGHFVIKSRSVLFLTAMGFAGGLIAHHFLKPKASSSKTPSKTLSKLSLTPIEEEKSKTFLRKVDDSISDELDVENEDVASDEMENFYGENREMQFDESLGYKSPYKKELKFEKPNDFMDISFNE